MRKRKVKELSEAAVYLNTNKIDNVPVSLVEACAMGVPVVATDVGGLSHLITHGENGLLVRDGDAKEMADAVLALLNDRGLSGRISKGARKLAEKFSWESVKKSWEELFEEIMSDDPAQNENRSSLRERLSE